MPYEVVQQLVAHAGTARSLNFITPNTDGSGVLLTGGRDRYLKLWSVNAEGTEFTERKVVYDHEGWVAAVLALPAGGFVTACQDNKLRHYNNAGELLSVGVGHVGPVTSLSINPRNGQIISGSWDGTARTWELQVPSMLNTSTLPDHENGVCVLGLPDGTIATGSSGVASNGVVGGFQIRLWKDGKVIKSMKEHTSSIRSLALNSDQTSFFSTGNDGKTIEWGLTGNLKQSYQNPISNQGETAFSYCVAANGRTGEVMTACDDFCVRVWKNGELVEQIDHPCEVWCVLALPNGDVVSAGADGLVRVFTREESRKANQTVREYYVQQTIKTLEEIAAKKAGGTAMDATKYPNIADAKPGTKPGENKLFNKNGEAWVYSWDAAAYTWVEIGAAMMPGDGGGGGGELNGIKYDKVIVVEVSDPATGGNRNLKLGVNHGDNPWNVAQAFLTRNGLPLDQLQQTVDFIQAQLGTPPPTQQQATERPLEFPMRTIAGFDFDKAKVRTGILEKLNEFNGAVNSTLKLSDQNMSTLDSLVEILETKNRYHASSFTLQHIVVLSNLLEWDEEHIFPVFDLIRVLFTHPEGARCFGQERSLAAVAQALETAARKEASFAVVLTATRMVANMFKSKSGAEFGANALAREDGIDTVLEPLRLLQTHKKPSVRSAIATIYCNGANALFHAKKQASAGMYGALYGNALELAEYAMKYEEPETVRRCLICIGTVLVGENLDDSWSFGPLENVLSASLAMKKATDLLKLCVGQLQTLVESRKD